MSSFSEMGKAMHFRFYTQIDYGHPLSSDKKFPPKWAWSR